MAPGSSQKCAEMKNASIAALVFASQAVVATKDNEYQSKQFHLVIDTLHMMALAFKSPDLIHLYIREASQWIIKLEIMFPNETVDPTYIYSANFMASKDQAMHAIAQHRQNHL
ncbi:hypothetical protein FBU30_010924 [Linnemannia zychae]|nr:hypothetical protein FBU30_010924 [Linnemannia zychae]